MIKKNLKDFADKDVKKTAFPKSNSQVVGLKDKTPNKSTLILKTQYYTDEQSLGKK